MVEVTVAKLGHDGQQKTFVVILQEKGGERVLPIWIGRPEAEAIAAQVHGIPRERPMTHDLIRSLVTALDATLTKMVVTKVVEHTYHAELHFARAGEAFVVDSRPSDAIAIALRLGAPLYAAADLFNEYEQLSSGDEGEAQESNESRSDAAVAESQNHAENLRRHLEQLKPEDFGKFSL